MPIRQLPQSLVNKIAAGEVIERPASVVKELMENAVDAGATRIDVAVEQGGLEMVRVVDNGARHPGRRAAAGRGQPRHQQIERGRRPVSRRHAGVPRRGPGLDRRSEPAGAAEPHGRKPPAAPSGGHRRPALRASAPCGCPVGTAVEVHNLFFNTPVRRKFLRSTQTEFGHVSEAFTRIALAAPQVHFTLRHNERPVFELAAADGWLERIARFFGRELAESLIWVESSDGPVRLSGYVAHPGQSRSHNRMQYFFLNGRHIRDRALQHALGEAYRGLLMTGRYADRLPGAGDAGRAGRRERPSDQAGGPLPGLRPALQPIAGHAAAASS